MISITPPDFEKLGRSKGGAVAFRLNATDRFRAEKIEMKSPSPEFVRDTSLLCFHAVSAAFLNELVKAALFCRCRSDVPAVAGSIAALRGNDVQTRD